MWSHAYLATLADYMYTPTGLAGTEWLAHTCNIAFLTDTHTPVLYSARQHRNRLGHDYKYTHMYDNACLITYNTTAELTSLEVIYIHIYGSVSCHTL